MTEKRYGMVIDTCLVYTSLRRHLRLYVALWVLGVWVVAEDVLFFLVVDPATLGIGPWAFTSERNYAENALMLVCMFVACRDAFRTLALRFEHPPAPGGERREAVLNDTLMPVSYTHLWPREPQP